MTGKVEDNSLLVRNSWMREGLVEAASKSFWQPFTGSTSDAIIYQVNDSSCSEGHTVVFDYSGKLTGRAIKGDNMAYGKGEIKRKFSDKITVDEYTIPVDNGKKFDGCDIGDLSINEHSDSRGKLSDLFVRWKDQMYFDVLQGSVGTPPTHIFNLGTTFNYTSMLNIEDVVKTGKGLVTPNAEGIVSATVAKRRAPLDLFRGEKGSSNATHLAIIDSYMALKIKADANYQTIVINADVRGNNNRAIDMVIGRIGKVLYVEAQDFFGFTDGSGMFGLEDSEIDFAGLRKYAELADGSIAWEGQEAFDEGVAAETATVYSRGLLLGGGAVQSAFGKMPDYKLEKSKNFGKTSESALEYWCNAKKTNLKVEAGGDFKAAARADLDFSVIALDLEHA